MQNEQNKETFKVDFHFENERDEILGIESATYTNGNQVKKFMLSDGRNVVVRELYGNDALQIDKTLATIDDQSTREEKAMAAIYHYAVKVEGKQIPMEDFATFKMKDYNKIKMAVQSLNF